MRAPRNNPKTTVEMHSITPTKLLGLISKSEDHCSKWSVEAIRIGLFQETKKYLVGYLPIASFLQTFLPWSSGEDVVKHSKLIFHNPVKRRDVCGSFIIAAEQLALKTLRFVLTQNVAVQSTIPTEMMPNVTVYGKDCEMQEYNFKHAEFWIKFIKDGIDPFHDRDIVNFDDVSGTEERGRPTEAEMHIGQMIAYATAHVGSGFFTHTFSVLIFGKKARLFRWDRAGAIVSEAFDYDKDSHLIEFFHRYDNLSPEERGRDTSVKTPSESDRAEAAKMLKPERLERETDEDFSRRREYLNPATFIEYTVYDSCSGAEGASCRFVGPPPLKSPRSLHGRATRGAPVWDVEHKKICYIKDTWRINSPDQLAEGKVYDILHSKDVPNIAQAVVHGDVTPRERTAVNYHVTHTDKLCCPQEPWRVLGQEIQGFIHYRIVLDTVGKDYTMFDCGRELLEATLDAMKAHAAAYSQAGILHRDISPGNIMISAEGRGFLIDWDLAELIGSDIPRSLGRTGTWKFTSAQLLKNPTTKIHEYSDDLESFLHTLAYTSLCFMKSSMTPSQIRLHIERIYDDFDAVDDKTTIGGYNKDLALCAKQYLKRSVEFVGRSGLSLGLAQISWLFCGLYRDSPAEEDEEAQRVARMHLNNVGQGGAAFMSKLDELIHKSIAWDDAPAEPVSLPAPYSVRHLNEYAARGRNRSSESSIPSTSLTSTLASRKSKKRSRH